MRSWWVLVFCLLLVGVGGASAAAQGANDAPVANDNSYRVKKGGKLKISNPGVLRNDLDPDGDALSAARTSSPSHGRLALRSGGSFVYTPDRGYRGKDSFTYRATDGRGGADTARVEITVWWPQKLPLARDDAYRTEEDRTLTVPAPGVLKNDAEADGRRLFATKVKAPGHGSLGLNRYGSFVYKPDPNFSGRDYFVYRATDNRGRNDTGIVRIAVGPVNDPPAFTDAAGNTSQTIDEGAGLAALAAKDADGDVLAFDLTGGSLPPGITLGSGGGFAGTAGGRAAGGYTASIRVSDGNGQSASTQLAVTVNPVEEAAVAEDTDVTTDEDVAKTITLSATDPDTDNLTFALGTPGEGSLGTPSAPDCAVSGGAATCTTTVVYTPDADYNGPDSFTFTAGDSAPATVGITVNPVNDEPKAEADTTTTPENTPLVFPAADLVANDSEGPANESTQKLSVGAVSDPANGTVSLDNDEITFTPQADYNGPASFDYTVCDDGNPQKCSTQTARVNVTVSPVNSAPTAQNDALTMDEDDGPIQIDLGPLVSDVETSDANLTYTIVSGPTSQQGALTGNGPTFTFDPAENFDGAVEISYKVADRGDPDGCNASGAGCAAAKESETRTVTVTVNPVNDPPANITLSSESVDENEASGTLVGTLSSADPDAGDAHSYALVAGAGSDDNGQFTVSGDELRTAAQFNKEVKSSYTIRISSTDSANETFEKQFTITVDNVNEAPTDIRLSEESVDENAPSGTVVGSLLTTDVDAGEIFAYELVAGSGSEDNGRFQIANDELQTDATFDYESDAGYTVRVRSTDSGGVSIEEAFTITVNDANDAPTAADDTATTDEDTPLNVSAPGVLENDADEDAGDTRTVGKLNGSGTLTGTSAKGATVTMNADGSYTYDPGSVFQQLRAGQDDTDTFTYKAEDNGGLESEAATVTITITGATDPAIISTGGTLGYTENAPAAPVDGDLGLTHPEGAQISQAEVEISDNYQDGEDILAFSDNDAGDGITLAPGSTGEKLTLTGADSAANYQAALRAVTYENTSEDPSALARTVTFTATDANSIASTPDTREIAVTPVDDLPSAVNDSATVLEDADATNIPVLDNDTDVDGGPKTVSNNSDPANGTVAITGGGTGLTYKPDANYCNDPPASNLDTFTYTLNGGSTATVSMTVTCVNDAPTVANDSFNGAVYNTSFVVDDSSDGAPGVTGAKKTITGDVLSNDSDLETPGSISVVANSNVTSTNGGKVAIESDGDFTYVSDPADNCSPNSDTFNYTVTDNDSGGALTTQGTITVNLSGCVWYVDNDPAETGNAGTSTDPFDALGSAQAKSVTNQTVFVYKGTSPYAGGFNLDANEHLLGEAANLVVGSDTLYTGDSAKRPTITANNDDVVALDDANEVRGVELDPQGTGGGIAGASGDTGGATIDDVNIVDNGTVGTQPALELDSTTGAFNISNLVVNNKATGVRLHNTTTNTNTVNAVFSPASQISITSNGGPGLDVDGTATAPVNLGTSTFDDITVTNSGSGGVNITNATGTINLGDGDTPDLSLTTTSGATPAFELNNAGNVTVAGAGTDSVSATGGPTINVSNMSGTTLDFDTMSSNGSSTDGVRLDNTSGTVTGSAGTIQNAGDQDVDISGNNSGDTVDFTYNGSITDDVGTLVNVSGQNGGTKDFNGAITDGNDGDGSGISLTNNTGATVRFDGGLTLSTGSNAAFSATGNGTVVVTDPVGLTDNTIATTTGTALNVANTTIGASGLNFRSISANGAPNGIVLNNTGTSGGLSVTGDGSTANSGGIIQNTAGPGGAGPRHPSGQNGNAAVMLTNTANVSLKFMKILTPSGNGILADDIKGMGNVIEKSVIDYNNTVISNAYGLRWESYGTSADAALTLDATTFQNKADGTTAVSLSAMGQATNGSKLTFNVKDSNTGDSFESKYTNLFGSGIVVGAGDDAGSTANVHFNVSNTKFVNAPSNGLNNLEMGVNANATLVPNISNNTFDKIGLPLATVGVINLNASAEGRVGSDAEFGLVSGNTITNVRSGAGPTFAYDPNGTNGYLGMRFAIDNPGVTGINHRLKIANNNISNMARQGILVSAREQATNTNVIITGNQVGTPSAPVGMSNRRGIELEAQETAVLNALVDNNTVYGFGSSGSNAALSVRAGVAGDVGDPKTGTVNATVTNNTLRSTNGSATGGAAFRAETISGNSGTMCLDLRANTLGFTANANTPVFELNNNGGTFKVEGAGTGAVTSGDIASTNNGFGATFLGSVVFNNNTNCTQPGF